MLAISQIALLIGSASMIGMIALSQRLIDEGIVPGDAAAINSIGLTMMGLGVVAGLAMTVTSVLAVVFAQGTALRLRKDAFDAIQTFSFENFDRFRTGRLLVNLSSDVLNVANATQFALLIILQAPFMIIIAVTLAALTSPSLLWLIGMVAVGVGLILAVIVPRLLKAFVARQERLDDVNNVLQENLAGVRVVKAFAREDLEAENFDAAADRMRKVSFKLTFMVGYLGPLIGGFAQLVVVLTLSIGSSQVFGGQLAVGELAAFTQYLSMIVMPLAMLAIVFPFLLRGDNSARRIFEIIDEVPAIADDSRDRSATGKPVVGRVEFEGVSFSFLAPSGELGPPVLHDIDLVIEAGQRVGILGSTGAGKTALANLITRFYDPTEGRITLDGVDLQDYPIRELRRHVGVALQEALLFQNDVRFNLKFGNPEVEDEVMEEAAKASDSYGFVQNLPGRWEAPVSRRGYNFSGGQRQRLSMARALTTQPSVLVLDDSTSALDAATEARVQAAIPNYAENLTTLYIAQRISAVIDLDKILLLDHGRIVGQGTHAELLQSSSMYQEIYESQLGGGITDEIDLTDDGLEVSQ